MADFKIKVDTVNSANPGESAAFLVDIGNGYNNIEVAQLRALLIAALEGRVDLAEAAITDLQANKSDVGHGHANASGTASGFMSSAHYTKLENITELFKGYHKDSTALNNAHPTGQAGFYAYVGTTSKTTWIWDNTLTTPAWVDTGVSSSGDMLASIYDPGNKGVDVYARPNHTGVQPISTVDGLQLALDGKSATGHVHAIADVTNLQASLDGKSPSGHIHTNATPSADGFMAKEDKQKLDGLSDTTITVDSALSTTSTNPVENKIVKVALDGKLEKKDGNSNIYNLPLKPATTGPYTLATTADAEHKVHRNTAAPTDTTHLWIDTSVTPNVWKRHNGTIWVTIGDNASYNTGIGNGVSYVDSTNVNKYAQVDYIPANQQFSFNNDVGTEAHIDLNAGSGRLAFANEILAGGLAIQDEGTALTAGGTALNFTGAGVTASYDSTNNKYDVAIPGGGSGKIRHDTYTALTLAGIMSWDVLNVAEGKAKITIPSGTAVADIAFSLANAADGFTGILAVYNNDTISHNLNIPTAGIYATSDGSSSIALAAGSITEVNFAHDGVKIKVTNGLFTAI